MFIDSTKTHNQIENRKNDAAHLEDAERVLNEVYDLLELYAPSWYSDSLRERIRSALRPKSLIK